jgi:hypothetical protein
VLYIEFDTSALYIFPGFVRLLNVDCPATSLSFSADSAEKILERASSASDGRAFRRSLNKTGRYIRKPVNDPDSLELMDEHGVGYSKYGLVARMRTTDYEFKMGDVRVKLAEAYGFCWGVERAVQMAYEARRAYPDKDIHVVNEIIHNPSVNGVSSSFHTSIPSTPVSMQHDGLM